MGIYDWPEGKKPREITVVLDLIRDHFRGIPLAEELVAEVFAAHRAEIARWETARKDMLDRYTLVPRAKSAGMDGGVM